MSTGHHVADVMAEVGDGAGSTGKGILIGILSAFGSAGVAIVVLAVFFFLKYTRRGRILLDRIGRPGEFDDEQAFAREEAEALETMDDLSRTEYLRAKGKSSPFVTCFSQRWGRTDGTCDSLHPCQSAGNAADRHLTIAIPGDPGKGRVRLGIRTRVRDCELFCRRAHRDRVL